MAKCVKCKSAPIPAEQSDSCYKCLCRQQDEQITELVKDNESKNAKILEARELIRKQAEQIAAYEEAIAENEITTADQQGTLDGLQAENQRLKEALEKIDNEWFITGSQRKFIIQALAAQPQGGSDE